MHHAIFRMTSRCLLAASLLAALGGCAALDALNLQKPTARVAGVRLQDIDLSAVTMLFDVELENPYSVPLPLTNLESMKEEVDRLLDRRSST